MKNGGRKKVKQEKRVYLHYNSSHQDVEQKMKRRNFMYEKIKLK